VKKTEVTERGATASPKRPRKTDGSFCFKPQQIADRWGWHVESVRRAIRQRRFESIIISRRRLVPISEVERIEAEGLISRTV